jgi:hypothetical protein
VNEINGRGKNWEQRLAGLTVVIDEFFLRLAGTVTAGLVRLVLVSKALEPHVSAGCTAHARLK